MRVTKEEFVKRYIDSVSHKYEETSIVYKTLKQDAEDIYDAATKYGVILVDREKLTDRLKDLNERLQAEERESYPKITVDMLVLRAGIGLIKELLG